MIHRWWQLAARNWRARFGRTLLHSVAVIIACALVVGLTGAFASFERALWVLHGRWTGATDLHVSGEAGRQFDQAALDRVAAVPGVRALSAQIHDRALLIGPGGSVSVFLRGRLLPEDLELHPVELVAGRLPRPGTREILVESPTAERYNLQPGEPAVIGIYGDRHEVTVVGVLDRPALLTLMDDVVHVPLDFAQQILSRQGRVDVAFVQADPEVDPWALAGPVEDALGPGYRVNVVAGGRQTLAQQLPAVRIVVFSLSSLALVVAMFLVFATISCGLVQRVGEMGSLRCLGASRGQIVRLVLIESLPLGLWAVALGVPAGLLGSWLVTRAWPGVFLGGWAVSPLGLALGAGGAVAATLIGALLPALSAGRVDPIAAYRPQARADRPAGLLWAACAGGALLALQPVWMWAIDSPQWVLRGHLLAGLPMMVAGLFLLAPLALVGLGVGLSLGAGWLLRVPPRLVAGQLLRGRWRNAGIATAIALCVTLVVSANTQRESLLAGYALPTGFPDLVVLLPAGVAHDRVAEAMGDLDVERWTGVNAFGVQIDADLGAPPPAMTPLASWQTGNAWFVSFEPDRMDATVSLEYLEGTPAAARALLEAGPALLVPEPMARALDLHAGDTLRLRDWQRRWVEFRVAGVVRSLSLEVAGSQYGIGEIFRHNRDRVVLGTTAAARQYFHQFGYAMVLADTGSPALSEAVGNSLRARWQGEQVFWISLGGLRSKIETDFRRVARAVSLVAGLLAAGVAAVGVANAMQASVHSRRRELGVLHAIGTTRSQLLRLVLAESAVLGGVGAGLGIALGLLAAVLGGRVHQLLTGGPAPVFTVPWLEVALVAGGAVAITLLASAAAALRAGRAHVLRLVKE